MTAELIRLKWYSISPVDGEILKSRVQILNPYFILFYIIFISTFVFESHLFGATYVRD